MRVVMLEWALCLLAIAVGLLALVQLPLELVSNILQRMIDQTEEDHWLAVVERNTRRQGHTPRRWRGKL